MKEDFLHYVWRFKLLDSANLLTDDNEVVEINNFGTYTQLQGPDFFNALIKINNQLWAGNVEMHVKSSDWYLHNHEMDDNYDNVILHVVWDHDIDVFNKANQKVPVLVLKNYVSENLYSKYLSFFNSHKIVNCESSINSVPIHIINNYKERLFIERLESKIYPIQQLVVSSKYNWQQVVFVSICKAFGLNTNGEIFKEMAQSITFAVVQKIRFDIVALEALFFGVLNLLPETPTDNYQIKLIEEFKFLKHKFNIQSLAYKPEFYKHRPDNFPTIRVAQLAMLFHLNSSVFDEIINAKSIINYYKLFSVNTSNYWETHYTFSSVSSNKIKKTSKAFVNLILINSLIPLLYIYNKSINKDNLDELIHFMEFLPPEINYTTEIFNKLQFPIQNAFDSQTVLQLKKEHCDKNLCLNCVIGKYIIK